MATQYWVGDSFIDLTRNQISQQKQPRTMPPKAMAVLTYLAKNANKVVSQDELLAEVWPDSVVTPNTLQRSIAQLRKVLDEGNQSHSCIKTHAKQGYSLECEVRWHDIIEAEPPVEQQPLLNADPIITVEPDIAKPEIEQQQDTVQTSKSTLNVSVIVVGIVILAIIGFSYLTPSNPSKLSIGSLRSLTATDNKELASLYTPDGQHVVFQRFAGTTCTNHLWAKNTQTQEEIQLTEKLGAYGSPSFSKDGKSMVLIKTYRCNKPVNQKECYQLMTLDFEKALKTPQSPSLLMECKNSKISRPRWLNNNNVALLQQLSNRWQLISYSIADNSSTVLYQLQDGNFFYFDYSVKDDLIALTSIHSDGKPYIEILKSDGQVLSSHQIEYPKEIAKFRLIYPNFTPHDNQLIFSTGKQLFTLSYDGKIANISLPLSDPMGSPVFHPGAKRMLVIKGHYDSDIATMPLSQIKPLKAQAEQSHNYSIVERSIQAEDNAIFQPNGKAIAFTSARTGEQQLWVTDGNGAQPLTNFPLDTSIYGMDWATDGKSILINANHQLTRVFLDSTQQQVPFTHPVEQLFQFNSQDNTALLTTRIKGIVKFVELNLDNSTFRVITDKRIRRALKTEDGRLIYTDHLDRFWQPGPAEEQLIEPLANQGSDNRFVIRANVIYGISEAFGLWSYDLDANSFKRLGDVPNNIDYITDINQTDILLTLRIGARKEVAELVLSH